MSLGLNKFGKSKSRSQQLKNVAKGSLPTEKRGNFGLGPKVEIPHYLPVFDTLWNLGLF